MLAKNIKRTALLIISLLMTGAYFYFNHPNGGVHSVQTSLDRHVPFIAVFIFPYVAFLGIFWAVFLYSYVRHAAFVRFAAALIIIYAISYAIYHFYQTYVPRPNVVGDDMASRLVRFVYGKDNSYNCLPSTHASTATLLAVYFFAIRNKAKWLIALFSALVVLSTFFIKQHYILDAISGILLGALISYLSLFRFQDQRAVRVHTKSPL